MSLLTRGLYPTEEVLTTWTTVTAARTWSGVDAESWTNVSTKLGAVDMDAPMLLAAMPQHLLVTAIQAWQDEVNPPVMEAVRMGLMLNALRLKYFMLLVDLLPPPVPAGPQANPPPTVAAPVVPMASAVKVKLPQVIDQGMDQEVPLLSNEDLSQMRGRFISTFGDPPLERAEVSDAQLTSLAFKAAQGLAPFADFGVWGPHGARVERRTRFTSHVLNPDGSWRTIELPGADCLDTWRDCWAVFKTAAVMCKMAFPATLDRYDMQFTERCRRYPDAWHLCAQADIRCRTEFIVEERRRQELFHNAHPSMSAFMPDMPWNSVLKAAASNSEFWDKELKEPALLYTLGRGKTNPSYVERQTEQTSGGRGKKRKQRGCGGMQQQPSHQSQQQQNRHQSPGNKGGGKSKASGKSGDQARKGFNGKYVSDRHGNQLCFGWNRKADGCTNGQCPNGRSHVCEICLQPHRTIHHGGGEGGQQDGGARHS